MAAVAGKGGSAKISTNAINVKNWNMDISVDSHEITALGASAKSYIMGLYDWAGSLDGNWDVASDTNGQTALQTAMLAGTSVALRLYTDGTHYYSGNAFVTGMNVTDDVGGTTDVSFDFQGSGVLAYN